MGLADLFVISALIVSVYDRLPRDASRCIEEQHVISENSLGDEVEISQSICGGIAYSDKVTLSLIVSSNRQRGDFFSYERSDADPIVRWSGSGVLIVNVASTGTIFLQKDILYGIKIQYQLNG
jgi:hypothetical protein